MKPEKFKGKVSSLYSLARRQRAVRLLLRALWTYGGGYLLGWGLNDLFGWPDEIVWYHLFGLVLVLFGFSPYIRFTPRAKFFWNMDRKLGYKEQFSTAWKVVDRSGEYEVVEKALLEEVLSLVPELRRRLIKNGRDYWGELVSGIIILVLFGMVWLAGFSIVPEVPPGFSLPIPGLGFDPSGPDIFPSGIPGDTSEANEGNGGEGSGDSGEGQEGESDLTSDELGEVGDVLSELGEELSENAATQALGEALEQGDLEGAADELEALAGQLDQLSEETREDMAEDFQNAAGDLQQPGQEGLSEQLEETGDALENGDRGEAGEQMDNLAEQLRAIGAQAASEAVPEGGIESGEELGNLQEGEGTGSGGAGGGGVGVGAGEPEQGDSEDFERLEGSGDVFDLSEFGDGTGLLQAGLPPEEISEEVIGGVFDYVGPEDARIISGVYAPYNLPWTRRNVITEYFSP